MSRRGLSFFSGLRTHKQGGVYPASVQSDILLHLRELLNTQQGASESAPEYGVADFADLMLEVPDSLRAIERELKRAIVRFEPRLGSVSVRAMPTMDDRLAFEVQAHLNADRTIIRFETTIAHNGLIRVGA